MVLKNNRSPKKENRQEEPRKEQDPKDYYFLREVIKEKPLDKKKLAVRAGGIAAGAVLFGVVAAFVFAKTEPLFREEETSLRVSIPEEEPTATPTPEATQSPTPEPETSADEALELDDFQNMFDRVMDVAEEPEKSLVSVQGFTSGEEWLAGGWQPGSHFRAFGRGQRKRVFYSDGIPGGGGCGPDSGDFPGRKHCGCQFPEAGSQHGSGSPENCQRGRG